MEGFRVAPNGGNKKGRRLKLAPWEVYKTFDNLPRRGGALPFPVCTLRADAGALSGHLTWSYEGGFAVEFNVPEKEKEHIEAEIQRFPRTMAEAEDGNEA